VMREKTSMKKENGNKKRTRLAGWWLTVPSKRTGGGVTRWKIRDGDSSWHWYSDGEAGSDGRKERKTKKS
jgi:hypothetical protein